MLAPVIDAHHHLWRYDPATYPWIASGMKPLQADFLPGSLEPAMRQARVDRAVVVQACQTVAETEWLLDLADGSNFIAGVVGWLPLRSPELPSILQQLSTRSKLKGLRHIMQDEPDPGFMLGDAFNRGIDALHRAGLVYDILIYASQLPQTIEFVRRHPQQRFVLDHCGKPSIGDRSFDKWREDLSHLAQYENVSCKISGLVTQTPGATWDLDLLRPCLDAVLEAFGPHRLMAGSDWPVCLLASTYQQWWSALHHWAAQLCAEDRASLFGGTACRIYNLHL